MTYRGGAASNWSFYFEPTTYSIHLAETITFFHGAAPIRRKHIKRGEGDVLGLTTFLIVLMLAFDIAACLVAVSLSLLMVTVALAVEVIRQSVRVMVKALDASITWIETRTDRALLRRLRA